MNKDEIIIKPLLEQYVRESNLTYYYYDEGDLDYITVGHQNWSLNECKEKGYIITVPKWVSEIYSQTLQVLKKDKYTCNTPKNL